MELFFAHEFGKAFVPKKIRPGLRRYLLKAGITKEPYTFFGIMFYICFGLSLLLYLTFIFPNLDVIVDKLLPTASDSLVAGASGLVAFIFFLLTTLAFIFVVVVVIYFSLDLIIYNRTKRLEEILPYFFDVLSANLKGGLSFDKALWMSIKPQFGILSNEIAIAAKKVMTGHDIDEALMEFAEKYDSPMLKRSLDLVIGQIQEGGKVAEIIDKVTQNLKSTKELKEEMTASVLSYVIFISIIVMFIAPALFALSKNLFEVIKTVINVLASSIDSSTTSLGFDISEITIDKKIFDYFSQVALGIIALFASMIVSIIEKGSIKSGVKYIPMYVITSQIVYLGAAFILEYAFGGIVAGV